MNLAVVFAVGNSNTTLVKVNRLCRSFNRLDIKDSNTTLVKVNLCYYLSWNDINSYSNTTLVKVNHINIGFLVFSIA